MFGDEQVLLSGSEDGLQRASIIYPTQNCKTVWMHIFPLKSKIMTFKIQIPMRSNIAVGNTLLE